MLPRIPFQLAHFPGLLAGLVVGAALLAIASAAGGLFLSSAGSRAATVELDSLEGSPALTVSTYGPLTPAFDRDATGALSRSLATVPDLGPIGLSVTGITGALPGASGAKLQIAGVSGFLGQIEPVTKPEEVGASGLWVPASVASRLGLHPGSSLAVEVGGATVPVPVAGVYRDLDPARLTAFWRLVPGMAASTEPNASAPPAVLLGSPDAVVATFGGVVPTGRFQWVAPIAGTDVSLDVARRLAAGVARVRSALTVPDVPPGSVLRGTSGVVPFSDSPLPAAVADARAARDELRASTRAISFAAIAIALLAMGAAGTYATRWRRVQADLLSMHGMGPAGQGALAAVEALVPVALGAALGWAIAVGVVSLLGPSSVLDPAARDQALRGVLRASAFGLVLYGVAAGVASRTGSEARRGRAARVAARTPWEPVVLVLAAASLYEIRTRSEPASAGPDVLLLAFPVLFVAGLAGLAARGLPKAVGALRGRVGPNRFPAFLAVRRVASASRAAVLLVAGTAIAVGILVDAGALSATVDRTSQAKSVAAAGSDLVVPLERPATGPVSTAVPPGAVPASTVVVRLHAGRLSPGGPVDVIAIDPATFERGAGWDGSFGSATPARLLADLAAPAGNRIPAIVAGAGAPETAGLEVQGQPFAVRIADRVAGWPGMSEPGRPLVVVPLDRMAAAQPLLLQSRAATAELWERGDPEALRSRLDAAGVRTDDVVTAEDVRRRPDLQALGWAIELLFALGVTAATVAVVGMVLHLQARQRSRNLSFALASRMGLSDRAHRRALTLELGMLIGSAAVIGSVLAVVAALLVRPRLEVAPDLPGPTVFEVPWALLAGVAAGAMVVAMAGGWLAQRRARRANAAEVLRGAG